MTKIEIDKSARTLRLRWYYQGSRTSLSLGVASDATGLAFAQMKKSEIAMDLISGYYDSTLLKYKPRKLGRNPTEVSAVALFQKINFQKSREHQGHQDGEKSNCGSPLKRSIEVSR